VQCIKKFFFNFNFYNILKFTPIHYVCKNDNDLDLVKFLIEKGADIDFKNSVNFLFLIYFQILICKSN
jgi:ankyrin repeat protein